MSFIFVGIESRLKPLATEIAVGIPRSTGLKEMAVSPTKDYKPEFEELGVDAVKRELRKRRWQPDKISAGRVWVESQDAHQWLADKGDAPPGDARKSFRKWAMYIAVVFGLGYVAARLLR